MILHLPLLLRSITLTALWTANKYTIVSGSSYNDKAESKSLTSSNSNVNNSYTTPSSNTAAITPTKNGYSKPLIKCSSIIAYMMEVQTLI